MLLQKPLYIQEVYSHDGPLGVTISSFRKKPSKEGGPSQLFTPLGWLYEWKRIFIILSPLVVFAPTHYGRVSSL